jgi:hypothetical protein
MRARLFLRLQARAISRVHMESFDSNEERHYAVPAQITKQEAVDVLKTADPDTTGSILYRLALYEPDISWVQDLLLSYADAPELYVRAMALKSLGALGRTSHPDAVHYEQVIPKILQRILDENDEYSGYAEEAIWDSVIVYWNHNQYQSEAALRDLSSGSISRAFIALKGIGFHEPDVELAMQIARKNIRDPNPGLRLGTLELLFRLYTRIDHERIREAMTIITGMPNDPVRYIREQAASIVEGMEGFLAEESE